MSTVSQLPASVGLTGVAGLPFSVTVALSSGGSPLTGVSAVSVGVYNAAGSAVAALSPSVSNPSTGVYTLTWTGTQMSQAGTLSGFSWSFECEVSGNGPFAVASGGLLASPPNVPGASVSASSASVVLGTQTVGVAVSLAA